MKHFLKPKNQGRIKNPDAIGEAGNILCGDVMKIYLKIGKRKGKLFIKDIKFETLGCVVAIANSSLLTEMAKGKFLDEVLKIKKDDLVKKLGKVPPIKIHCSVLALEALHEAIYNYLKKKGLPIPKILERTHKRVGKIRKEIEERYEDFVKMEREMLGKND